MRAHKLRNHACTFGTAGNLISKANACPSTAALQAPTLQPKEQRHTRMHKISEQRAQTLQVDAIAPVRLRVRLHKGQRALRSVGVPVLAVGVVKAAAS